MPKRPTLKSRAGLTGRSASGGPTDSPVGRRIHSPTNGPGGSPNSGSTNSSVNSPANSPTDSAGAARPKNYAALPLVSFLLLLVAWFIQNGHIPETVQLRGESSDWVESPVPLAMKGGDPYIRALMRTISASESNTSEPYALLYGGELVQDLSRHPDICIEIVAGPNLGDCTTAAGRYQFLTTTWEAKAEAYHPAQSGWFGGWRDYSFQPEDQDTVVYRWLSDTSAWGVDISEMLQQGRLDEVLYMLSGTWTSLGYGIETNSMSGYLPQIYQQMLQEELTRTGGSLVPGNS